ncbi:MAG: polysaccharide biosynthesis/export family protein [Rikenellaceae bacterium]
MTNRLLITLASVATIALLNCCTAYKKIPYLSNADLYAPPTAQRDQKELEIKPNDLLSIEISTSNPKGAEPFNLNTSQSSINTNNSVQERIYGYLVDADGNIDFPIVGKLQVMGLTNIEASNLVRESLSPYLKERPVVRIRIINFQVSVLGEVVTPGVIEVLTEQINIFEALALAGDMTLYGVRDRVKVVRELPNGRSKIVILNLQDSDVIDSEYYYLQQNDVVYVEANKSKANTSAITASSTIWITFTSALISIASFVLAFIM